MAATVRSKHPLAGYLLVVGGQCRKVGKSALVVDIIKAFPNRHWTAVKITPYAESGCPIKGSSCACREDEHLFAIHEELSKDGASDSSRFLAAGAQRALWLQSKAAHLQSSLPALKEKLVNATHVIIESDALMKFWRPSLFLMVLDPANPDFKSSARENLSLADAFVFRSPFDPLSAVPGAALVSQKPQFLQPLGVPLPSALKQLLAAGSISGIRAISPLGT